MKTARRIVAAVLSLALVLTAFAACGKNETAKITIDAAEKKQTFEGFGVSSAWWSQDVGGWTEKDSNGVPVREAVMDKLYGNSGLALQIYRYNLGAGTGTGEKKGEFWDSWRSGQSFIDDSGNIDYTLDKNALWCLDRALKLGNVTDVVFFSNSAPDSMTVNGKPHSDKQKKKVTNLAPEKYQEFTDYVLDAVEHFRENGVPVTAVSPINEPQWTWQGGQEGCHFEPDEAAAFFRVFYEEMQKRGLTDDVRLSLFESGQWGGAKFKKWFKAIADDELLGKIMMTVEAHSYNSSTKDKAKTSAWLDKNYPGLRRACTEWTEMEDLGRDVGMDSAVVMADMICTDFNTLRPVSWCYWLGVSRYDWRDGLMYADTEKHTYEMTKRYYEYGNFTKFIKPGAVMLSTEISGDNLNGVCFENGGRLVSVLVNKGENEESLELNVKGGGYYVSEIHITDGKHNLERNDSLSLSETAVRLPAKSVVTVVMEK